MTVQVKPEVDFNLNPEILSVLGIVEAAYNQYGLPVIITSGQEPCVTPDRRGCHLINSSHYSGNAFDFRSKGIPYQVKQAIISRLKSTLPIGYRLIWEQPGKASEHFHLQYEPSLPQFAFQVLPWAPIPQQQPVYTGGFEDYDRDPEIPIEAPLPGGYMVPVMAGETWSDETIWTLVVGGLVLFWVLTQ